MINIWFILCSGLALCIDVLIISVCYRKVEPPDDDDDDAHTLHHEFLHKILYLEVLAFIRLVLLLPQFVNSVSGKRLSYPRTMTFIIMGTLAMAIGHVIVIVCLRGLDDLKYLSIETVDDDSEDMGMVWAAVLLTVLSCVLHRLCLRFLRTTAPPIHGKYTTKAGSKHASKRLAYHYRKILNETRPARVSSVPVNINVSEGGVVSLASDGADEAAGGGFIHLQSQQIHKYSLDHVSSENNQKEIEVPLLSPSLYSSSDASETESLLQDSLYVPGDNISSLNDQHLSILDRLKLQLKFMQHNKGCHAPNQYGCFPDDGNEKKNGKCNNGNSMIS